MRDKKITLGGLRLSVQDRVLTTLPTVKIGRRARRVRHGQTGMRSIRSKSWTVCSGTGRVWLLLVREGLRGSVYSTGLLPE